MKFNKATQYALLLSMYLGRSGRAKVEDISANLNLSKDFLSQVAYKLRIKGVVKSVKGPGGGYELTENTTVLDVLNAMGVHSLLSTKDTLQLSTGTTEQRALVNFVGAVSYSLSNILTSKIKDVTDALVQQETEQLDSLDINSKHN